MPCCPFSSGRRTRPCSSTVVFSSGAACVPAAAAAASALTAEAAATGAVDPAVAGRRRRRGSHSVAPRDARPRAPAAARGPRRHQRKSAWQHGSARRHCSSREASQAAGSLLARRRRCSSGARPAPAPLRSRARTDSVPLLRLAPLETKRAVTAVVGAVPRGQLVGLPARRTRCRTPRIECCTSNVDRRPTRRAGGCTAGSGLGKIALAAGRGTARKAPCWRSK